MLSDEYSSGEEPVKKKIYTNKQKVCQNVWLENVSYKRWLVSTENKHKCKCTVCNTTILCVKSEINKHANSLKHQRLVKLIDTSKSIIDFVPKESNLIRSVKDAEISLAAFFAEHNVALLAVDHLVPLLKKIAPDSKIISDMKMGRTKCTAIIKSVLGTKEKNDLIIILKNNIFSILLDESTDISDKKYLCLLVRYIYKRRIETSLLELIELDAKDCSAQSIFNIVMEYFNTKSIPMTNIIGVASDGAAVMVGKNNSFFSKLKEVVPHVILFKCICHSSVLIAAKACKQLPRTPEDLIRNIGTYISGSSKRCAVLGEFQEFFNNEKKKILKLSTTRWLSMYDCVKRVLDNWNALLYFFTLAAEEDHLKMATTILESMQNPLNKGYLLFLSYTLKYFNDFNALFQSRRILINELHTKSLEIFWQFTQNFVKPEMVHSCHKSNIRDPLNYIALENISLGYACAVYVKIIPKELVHQFRLNCLNFYLTTSEEMQKRLPLTDIFFKELNILTPHIALDLANRDLHSNFSHVVDQYKDFLQLDVTALEYQWRKLPFSFTESKLEELKYLDVDKFWFEIGNIRDENNRLKFNDVLKLINVLLVLPHSNAEAERVFSIMMDCKSKKRNRLGSVTLDAMAVFRSSLQNKNQTCNTFNVEQDHRNLLEKIYKQ